MARKVYILFSQQKEAMPEVLKVYSKTSYPNGFNFVSDLAEGNGGKLEYAKDNFSIRYVHPVTGQMWWLSCHEVE